MKFEANLTLCQPHIAEKEDVKIQRIGPMNWITYLRTSNIMTERCQEDTTKRQVQGTYLITINEDCDLYLGDIKLDRRRSSIADTCLRITPIISLPELKKWKQKKK
ncbi:hypothetical protein O0L34_g19413 [Tuta absoluta]|nr:hypothetical protein O0L34_g19413 [Tuta absoluta]